MEPIAIIGIGCRFPGAKAPEAFWHLLRNGVDAITEVPKERWDIDTFYDPEPAIAGKMNTRWGGFLEQVDQFDPSFFGISPREAERMDPQQRLVLEVAWEALENAGLAPDELAGSQTGVFMGIGNYDYCRLLAKDLARINAYDGTGNTLSIAANRLSYILNLRGPSVVTETACSSSLVALHFACRSLQSAESNLCLVGGVSLTLSPEPTITYSHARMMAADGRCKTFDASADGYVRGEGCGVVILKRLSDALRDGDNIQAIIRGSAVNQDGLSNGLTAPNGPSQQAVIRQALENSGVTPAQISYVEAHGTGTSLGDPIEVKSLKAVLMQEREPVQPCWIGSVKTNIGHLEAASGMASIIKVVLSLQHGKIPPHLHLKQLNPYISLEGTTFSIPTECQPWSTSTEPRFAGVSAFGFGGTNCHVILEEAPSDFRLPILDFRLGDAGQNPKSEIQNPKFIERPFHLLTLSAKSEKALGELAQSYADFLATHPAASLADICFTANRGRSHFDHRLAVVAESTLQLREQLEAFAAGRETAGLVSEQITSRKRPKIAFLFTGQGSQYVGMGRQLYDTQPVFRQTLDLCDEILRPYLGESLLTVLYPEPGETSRLDQTAYTQSALFALEYALVQLWKSWGVHPDAVMGHSVGEYVAACVAGVFSLEDGLKLIAERAHLAQSLPQDGEMVAVFADEAAIRAITEINEQKIAFAAYNGPQNTVISGEQQAVRAICAALSAKGIKTLKLQTSHAFHSPLMEPMLADFRRVAASVTYAAPQIDLISNVTGQLHAEAITPEYWCRHLRQGVRFAASLKTLHTSGYEVFVEIGPKPTLLAMGRHCLPEGVGVWLPSLRPGQQDWQQMLQSLGELYVRGVSVDWFGFDRNYPRRRLALPTYPFQRQRYWVETTEVASQKTRLLAKNVTRSQLLHPLLGQRLHLAGSGEIRFESQITQEMPAFLRHHRIYQMAIVPATAYLEMALAAGTAVFKSSNLVLEGVAIQQALMLPEQECKTIQLVLTPQETKVYSFQIFSFTRDEEKEEPTWTLHASGKVKVADKERELSQVDLASLQAQYTEEVSVSDHYQQFRKVGIDYGPSFQAIEQIWRHQEQALSRLRTPKALDLEAETYQLHPVLLDACFQVLGGTFSTDAPQDAYLPIRIERLEIYRRPGTDLWTQVQIIETQGSNRGLLTANLSLFDTSGSVVAQVEGLAALRTSRKALQRILQKKEDLGNWLYQITWQPQPYEPKQWLASVKKQGSWLIFADRGGIGVQLADQLRAQGDRCVLVFSGEIYQRLEAEHYQINPLEPLDLQRLFQNIVEEQSPLRGVVHLWSLEGTLGNETSIDALQNAQTLGCGSVLHLVQALAPAGWSGLQHLWLVTRGAQSLETALSPLQVQQAPLWGLGRVIALEHPDLHCVCLDLEPSTEQDEISTLLAELCSPDREDQIAYRQGVRYVPRLVRQSPPPPPALLSKPFQLKISSYGILENLTLAPMTRRQPEPGEVEIQVRATGLNFRDVLNALGMLQKYSEQLGIQSSADMPFGGECAGTIVAVGKNVADFKVGDEVIAAPAIGSFSSFVTVNAEFVALKPQNLSFEEAATIPIAFLTAYYGLHTSAQIQPGDRVMIHAAAGGVGQAAVQLAQRAGAQVFATASPSKWDFLKSIGVEHVMNSRTLDFAEEVMAITEGQGVNIVLNSLNGEFIAKSFEVLSQNGRFIEIGKIGIWDERQVQELRPDVSYFPFDLLDISIHNPSAIALTFKDLMQEFRQGILQPLPHKVFPMENVVSAFRYLARSKHIGKVVVSQPEMAMRVDSLDKELVREDSSYLITGGLGALGLKVAHWMVEQGARHLILIGRSGASEAVQKAISQLEQTGTRVLVAQANVSKQEDVARVLETVQASMPPLRGIVHAAGVLDDGVLQQLSWERFTRVMAPKVEGAWNLHILTQNLPLDFFVLFSSVASLIGSPGQGNYAAANAFMDVLAHHRQAQGLPGLSINWGPWAEAGMAASLGNRNQARLVAKGLNTIAPEQGLQVLEQLLKQSTAQVGVFSVRWSDLMQQFAAEVQPPYFTEIAREEREQRPLLEKINTQPREAAEQQRKQQSEILQRLSQAPSGEHLEILVAYLQEHVTKALGFSSSLTLDLQQSLLGLGLDSLMAIQLKNAIAIDFEVNVDIEKFIDGASIVQLAELLLVLRQQPDAPAWSPLVAIQPGGDKPPLFCIHPVGGNVLCYADLAAHLGREQPFYGLQSPGLDGEQQPLIRVEDMAAHYIAALQTIQPQGPYHLGGWSFGGVVAFEMAQQLHACGHEVALLALLDSYAPSAINMPEEMNQAMLLASFAKDLGGLFGQELSVSVDELQPLGLDEQLHHILERANKVNLLLPEVGSQQMRQLFQVFQTNLEAMYRYRPQPYPGRTILFASEQVVAVAPDPNRGWGELAAGGLQTHTIPGNHYTIVRSQVLAELLKLLLQPPFSYKGR